VIVLHGEGLEEASPVVALDDSLHASGRCKRRALCHGDRYDRPRGLTTEQNERQRTGEKLSERQVREAAHGGLGGKQQVERLNGTDDVTTVKKGRG
jgi:hypothetical protein